MNKVSFDFDHIQDVEGFYRRFAQCFTLDDNFGHNLDALWDALTGLIDLPVRITLRHLSRHPDPAQFDDICAVLHEAEAVLAGGLVLRLH
ncbi:barstar family protein [Erwinia sp. 9145]|uniref:barstar family protein n=1 Tax=Erwinia sp. 9145 TaxID=1500895 RepID=UPI00055516BD|nr:barstar family protein [Erwinia sp. 9145]